MNRSILEKAFPGSLVRTRKGGFGKELAFVGAAHYIRRLNEAFESQWSWRIIRHEFRGSEVVVQGILEAGGQAKHAFGGAAVTVDKQTGEVLSTADDLKAASTDALKKAASLFGVGLDLYTRDDEGTSANRPAEEPERPLESEGAARHRITAKQLKAIFAIARIKNVSDAELRQTCIKRYGSPPDFLSKADASSLIDSLKAA